MRVALLPLCLALAASAPGSVLASPTAGVVPTSPIQSTEAERAAVLDALAATLRDGFVTPREGADYAAFLEQPGRLDAYRGLSDADFADAVTEQLQAIHHDAHLRVFAPEPAGAESALAGAPATAMALPTPMGRTGWLDDGVAYIAFNAFFA